MGEFDATALHSEEIERIGESFRIKTVNAKKNVFEKAVVFGAQSRGSIGSLSKAKTPKTHS